MPDKPDEEIRKSIKRFEESLPESERNPDAQRLAHQRRRRRPMHARVSPLREFAYLVQHGQATAGDLGERRPSVSDKSWKALPEWLHDAADSG